MLDFRRGFHAESPPFLFARGSPFIFWAIMETLIVDGPTPLKGEIEVAGAKNSMSKLLTASMLTAESCSFTNVPEIGDTEITKLICEALGARCSEIGPKALSVELGLLCVCRIMHAAYDAHPFGDAARRSSHRSLPPQPSLMCE